MDVRIVDFPETPVAAIEHRGAPALEHETVRKMIAWKLEQGLLDPLKYRSYGVHYTDPRSTRPEDHRVDICLSVDFAVAPNAFGIVNKVIPRNRCALARDIGSRHDNQAVIHLVEQWLPHSGEQVGDYPVIFHYVNVGPKVRAADMITEVYLPLRPSLR